MRLRTIAHGRAGDKGRRVNLSVIAFDPADYPRLAREVTAERVRAHLADLIAGPVIRYELPQLAALNFVLERPRGRRRHRDARPRSARQVAQRGAPRPGDSMKTDRRARRVRRSLPWPVRRRTRRRRSRASRWCRASRWRDQAVGAAGPYEIIRGRVHGEVDPADRRNAIIQDLALAPRNARGRAEYVATFALAKPVDLAKASGVLIYSVVNRGNGSPQASADGHVWLVSGWQGDLPPAADKQTIAVPVARNADGTPITGRMIARFANAAPGTTTLPIRHATIGNPPPAYPPAGLEQRDARLISVGSETTAGVQRDVREVPRADWALADCRTVPFPGTPDATQLCVKGGFDPTRLYQLSYTVQDPLVLGIGLAATRDITAFFRGAAADAQGTPNPVAGAIRHVVAIGDSQSGNFIRTFIHLGFNEGADGRAIWDGAFPRIAARQTPINVRFGVPGGAAGLFEAGSEPAIWWGGYEDRTRRRRRASLLDRCTASRTCPKIVEAFGSAEFWGLRMSPDLVGTDARTDIPLPANVRRYYYPGTTHGGGRGGFVIDAAPAPPGCTLPANPNPQADTTRALTRALVDWVVRDTAPPDSRYPRLARGELVPPTAMAAAFARIPGARDPAPLLNPFLEYEFGPGLVLNDLTGVLRMAPPRVRPGAAVARAAGRPGRQRARRRPVGAAPGAARHLSRMERLRRRLLQGSGLRLQRRLPAVRANEGGARGAAGSAAVAGRALPDARRLRPGGARGRRGRRRAALPAARGRRSPDRRSRAERRAGGRSRGACAP